MTTDFTRKGAKNVFIAYKDAPSFLSILSDTTCAFLEDIEKEIATCNQNAEKSRTALSALGCFERFRGCIIYVWRIAQYENFLKYQAPDSPGEATFIRGTEALVDFESLLFHGRSALDRIAFFISKQIYSQDCDKYPKLKNVINNFQKRDNRATILSEILASANTNFEGILYDFPSGRKSLRSHVIHKSTASENTDALFTIHCIRPKRRIAFDSIIGDFPLIQTTSVLGQTIAFVILNALSIYLLKERTLSLEEFKLKWNPVMVDYRKYMSDGNNTEKYTVWNTTPSGCRLSPVSLRPEIMNKSY
jgi:hypothetical protein